MLGRIFGPDTNTRGNIHRAKHRVEEAVSGKLHSITSDSMVWSMVIIFLKDKLKAYGPINSVCVFSPFMK